MPADLQAAPEGGGDKSAAAGAGCGGGDDAEESPLDVMGLLDEKVLHSDSVLIDNEDDHGPGNCSGDDEQAGRAAEGTPAETSSNASGTGEKTKKKKRKGAKKHHHASSRGDGGSSGGQWQQQLLAGIVAHAIEEHELSTAVEIRRVREEMAAMQAEHQAHQQRAAEAAAKALSDQHNHNVKQRHVVILSDQEDGHAKRSPEDVVADDLMQLLQTGIRRIIHDIDGGAQQGRPSSSSLSAAPSSAGTSRAGAVTAGGSRGGVSAAAEARDDLISSSSPSFATVVADRLTQLGW
jgi:hypothetical protein